MTMLGRDVGEIEALVTDRYLDALLSGRADATVVAGTQRGRSARRSSGARTGLDDAVRLVSGRLAGDLPRFHPSFRFEERLALQLAEAAAAMRLPVAAGSEGQPAPAPAPAPLGHLALDPLAAPFDDEEAADADGPLPRPVLIGGAVAASAISLAGAWLAWRRRGSGAAFARAVRAAHALGPSGASTARRRARRPVGS